MKTKNAYSYKGATELIRNAQAEDVVLCDLQLGDDKTALAWQCEGTEARHATGSIDVA